MNKSDTAESNKLAPEQEKILRQVQVFNTPVSSRAGVFFLEALVRDRPITTNELSDQLPTVFLARERYDINGLEARARALIEDRNQIEHDGWQNEPEINARTSLFEELTAKGHFSHIAFEEEAELTNARTLQRLINGYSDSLLEWEKQRRFQEIVEELIIQETFNDIKTGQLPVDTFVITISDYPEMADPETVYMIGYRSLNEKGMVRGTYFELDDDSIWRRAVDQISRSNSTDDSSYSFLSATAGYRGPKGSKQVLASQVLATRGTFPEGIVDVQRAIDSHAGPNVIYGEDRNQPNLNLPAYEELRAVSAFREQQAEVQIKKLADFERQLNIEYHAGTISYEDKLRAIDKRRKELVNEICILDPSYAKDARGEAAAEYFQKAALAMAAGNDMAGMTYLADALVVSDPRASAVCGGNGLPTTTETNNSIEARLLYLEAKEDREKWKWSRGVCVVKECPSRPAKTEVGPCSVCRKCQSIFDKGNNPKMVYKTLGFLDLLFESVREFNQKFEAERQEKRIAQLAKVRAEKAKQAENLKQAA